MKHALALLVALGATAPCLAQERPVLAAPYPEYPSDARRGKVEGCAIVRYTVNPDGTTGGVSVLDAQPAGVFEKPAILAVNHWRYAPKAEPSYHVQSFSFQLKPANAAEVLARCSIPESFAARVSY